MAPADIANEIDDDVSAETLTFNRTSNPAFINKIVNGSKDSFIRWTKGACQDRESADYKELHGFLFRCFNFADDDFDGLCDADGFNMMVERAAALPRLFGFAPAKTEMFKTSEECRTARAAMFKKLNPNDKGLVGFDQWLKFCYDHICEKSKVLDQMYPSVKPGSTLPLPRLGTFDRDGFKKFLLAACKDTKCVEYKELYRWLQKHFINVDTDQDGRIAYSEFDILVNMTGAEPRRLGFAPSIEETYKTQLDMIEGRMQMFKKMDKDNTGFIGFSDFLDFMYTHICEKTKTIDEKKDYKACQCTFVPEQPDRTEDQMPMDKSSFVVFVKSSMTDRDGPAFKTLYNFLLRCFNEADCNFDGTVDKDEFDTLVERAAILPRMFGFAPSASEMYKTPEERIKGRAAYFEEMDTKKRGAISFEEWLDWNVAHIAKKATVLNVGKANRKLGTFTRGEFSAFILKATASRTSMEYKELYRWLLNCFEEADTEQDGEITPAEFDNLVDLTAAEPRRLGFAPKSSEQFKTKAEKAAARTKMFEEMDTDKKGVIGFHQFLKFTMDHITEKAKSLSK